MMISSSIMRPLLSVAVIAAVFGNALIWVSDPTTDSDGMFAFFLVIIALVNFAAFSTGKAVLLEVASLLMAAIIFNPMCRANAARLKEDKSALAGYVFASMGCFLSFAVHFQEVTLHRFTHRQAMLAFASVLWICGLFSMWAYKDGCSTEIEKDNNALWPILYNVITLITNNAEGQNVVFFLCSMSLYAYAPAPMSCNGDSICKGGISTMFVAILIILTVRLTYALLESEGLKARVVANANKVKTDPQAQLAAFLLLVSFIGAILIWSGTVSKTGAHPEYPEGWLTFLLFLVTVFEVVAFLTECPMFAVLSLAIMGSIVSSAVANIYPNTDQQMRAGYIMCMISAFGSLSLPIDFSGAKQKVVDPESRTRVMIGLALVVAAMMMWARQLYYLIPGFIGILSTLSGVTNYKEGGIISFYMSVSVLPLITPFTVGVTSNAEAFMLSLLAILALLASFIDSYQVTGNDGSDAYERVPIRGEASQDAPTKSDGYGTVDDGGVTSLA